MLRWCLSTLRTTGGRSNASFNVARSASTVQPAFQLRDSTRERSVHAIQESLLSSPKLDGHHELSLATSLTEEWAHAPVQPSALSHVESHGATVMANESRSHTGHIATSSLASGPATNAATPSQPEHTLDTDSASALPELKQFLTAMTTHVASTTLPIPTANAFQLLYHTVKANSQLDALTSADTSSLIALFGSLSLSTSDRPYSSIYAHPWSRTIRQDGLAPSFWPLVIELGADALDLWQTLDDSDHFWLMHAHLAQLQGQHGNTWSHEQSSQAFKSATNHYRAICHTSSHPRVHATYLEMLLGQPDGYIEAANILSQLIRRDPRVHPRILDYLWRTVLEGSAHLTTASRSQLLLAIYSRSASRLKDYNGDSTGRGYGDMMPLENSGRLFGMSELVKTLVETLSDPTPPQDRRLQASTLHILQTFFQADPANLASVDLAWSNLALLALVNGSSAYSKIATASPGSIHFHPSDWQAICILAQLENLLQSHDDKQHASPSSVPNNAVMKKLVGSLWTRWVTVKRADTSEASELEWSILRSFLYLVGRLCDEHALDACEKYIDSRMASTPHQEVSWMTAIIPQILAEYVLAALSCGHELPGICHWILRRTEEPSSVVYGALSRLVLVDPVLAHELCVVSKNAGVPIEQEGVVLLGKYLTEGGHVELALGYVHDMSLGLTVRIEVLKTVIQAFISYPRDPRYAWHWDTLASAVIAVLSLESSQAFRTLVTSLLLSMLNQGRASSAILILQSALQASPEYFALSDLQAILDLLIRHRQFRIAGQLFQRIVERGTVDSAWRERIVKKLARGGAHRIASQAATHLPLSTSPSQTTLAAADHRVESPSTVTALKIRSILSRPEQDEASITLGVQLLIAGKRIKTAREFFEREHHHLTPAVRTTIGNELIHAYFTPPTRRHPHRMKGALRVLKDLTANCQFAPDRVTMNILVKGLLQWTTELDRQGVRTLFDRLVLAGYSTGGLYDPGVAPFGSTTQQQESAVPLPKVTTPISFKKHTKPLYKMFIKAMHVAGDVHGARKVVGILKAAQEEWQERVEKSSRVRVK